MIYLKNMDCFVVFASLKLPRNDEISGRFCETCNFILFCYNPHF
ncbi:hypothetical protein ACWIUD_09665 [Helicobacter sp. 23-1044]